MHKLIIAALALTATAQPALSQDAGPYVGVQVVAAQIQTNHSDEQGWYNGNANFGISKANVIGGVFAGYESGQGPLTAGVEAEVNFGALDSLSQISPLYNEYQIGTRTTVLGSARAKLGLRSGKLTANINGGFAFSNSRHRYLETDGSGEHFDDKGSRGGWVVGFGLDYSLGAHSSIGLATSYYQFPNRDHTLLSVGGSSTNCSWSAAAAADNLCHFKMGDKFATVAVKYKYHF